MDGKAYVYAILVDGVVRYIGKGTGRRMHEHVKTARRLLALRASGRVVKSTLFYNRLAKAFRNGLAIHPTVVAEGLSDEEAYARERVEIAATASGQLWNYIEGGRGFTSADGYRLWEDKERRAIWGDKMKQALASEDVRQRISEGTKRGLASPGVLFARRKSQIAAAQNPETRSKKSASMKALWADPSHRQRYWESRSEETFARMSVSAKRRGISPERRAKMAASLKSRMAEPEMREKWRRAGIEVASRPEVKQKQSEASKRMWADPEWRARVLGARKLAREKVAV